MIWILYSFLSAFGQSLKDVFSKHGLKDRDEYAVGWASSIIAMVILIPIIYITKIPTIDWQFFRALLISGFLNVVALVFYMKAYKASDLSITAPMLAFSPLFLLVTSPLIVNEYPNIYGVIGIILIVIGSYLLNINKRKTGYLMPFKILLSEAGPKYMLGVAFLWSISANFDKIGVVHSSPLFWVFALQVFIVITLFPVIVYRLKGRLPQLIKHARVIIPIGFFQVLNTFFSMAAIQLAFVSYVISIKRTSALFSVIFGYLIFREKRIKERIVGAFVMVIGVLFITLFQ